MSDPLPRLLAELQRLQSPGGRKELQAYSMEGTRLVERALSAGATLRSVLCSASYACAQTGRAADLLAALAGRGQAVQVCSDEQLAQFTRGRTFGDVLAIAPQPEGVDLAALLAAPADPAGPCFHPGALVVVDAADPGNVGALLRTALASGARAFVSIGTTDPLHPKAVRTSMGSLFRLPLCHYASADEFLEAHSSRMVLCGAVSRGGQAPRSVRDARAPDAALALCVGSEAFGLDERFQAQLDQRLTIPMPPGVDSLSINAAAAICLHELLSP